jgi:DNA-binding MarR family transcriptional regulator
MKNDARELNTIMRLVETFRTVDAVLPAQMAQCFLAVAIRPGLTAQNLAEMTSLSQAAVNRNIRALGKRHRYDKPGLELIEAVPDPAEPRRNIMSLTAKGEKLAAELIRALQGEECGRPFA